VSSTGFKDSISVPGRHRASGCESEHQVGQRVFYDIEVDFGDQENFLFAYIRDLEGTGIFVRTLSPEAPGTHVNVRFTPGGTEPPMELDGKVIWINPYRPHDSNNLSPGMGIRFLGLTCEQRHRLIALVRRFAYLADDISAAEPSAP
jgi:uncharacterized protein (TIGR02266 family)